MARKPSSTLTDSELRLMEVLWESGPATVAQVVDRLSKQNPLAYNTVLTTLGILERKDYVAHTKEGRAFVYHPRVDRTSARGQALRDVMRRFFDNSPRELVLNLFEQNEIDPEQLAELRRELDEEPE